MSRSRIVWVTSSLNQNLASAGFHVQRHDLSGINGTPFGQERKQHCLAIRQNLRKNVVKFPLVQLGLGQYFGSTSSTGNAHETRLRIGSGEHNHIAFSPTRASRTADNIANRDGGAAIDRNFFQTSVLK